MTKEQKAKIESENKKKLRWIIISISIAGIIFVSGMTVISANLLQKKVSMSREIKTLTTERDTYAVENTKAQDELAKMKARIAGIKNNDDLLKRDIELYITYNYNKISKIVAKTIAINVVKESNKQETSPELVMGIIQVESVFNPMQVGKKTKYGRARGLMQVMPEWVEKFGIKSKHDLHDIDTNIKSGIRVFNIHLKEANGDISGGLYLYVNKDKAYVKKVYTAVGKFVSFRSTVDDDEKSEEVETPSETDEKVVDSQNKSDEKDVDNQNKSDEKEILKKDGSDEAAKRSIR
jgi:hypothetical protein